jgi:hypothetical protein
MKAKKLTPELLQQLIEDVRQAGNTARSIGGHDNSFSYAAMSGCLSSLLKNLVKDLAGTQAGQEVDAALNEAFGKIE